MELDIGFLRKKSTYKKWKRNKMDKFLVWKDKEIDKYCITKLEGVSNEQDLIKWLKKEMAGFTYPRIEHNFLKTYRGQPVAFIHKLELIDCYKKGKNIHSFYYDMI
jgi:hypothetical protein